MPAVSETIVREYFELHGFFVRQHRKFVARNHNANDEDDVDFFVLNPQPQPQPRPSEFPFVLTSVELAFVNRAIVVVKGWHTETFSTARLTNTPEFFALLSRRHFNKPYALLDRTERC